MLEIALLVVFPALMAYAAASDLLTMTIPNTLSIVLTVAFAAFAVMAGLSAADLLMHLGAGMLVLAVCFGLFAFGWVGGGDAKLAAVTALWLGFQPLLEYLFIAALAGGVLSVMILILRRPSFPVALPGWIWLDRLRDERNGVPYGIALALAALAVYPHSSIWMAATQG